MVFSSVSVNLYFSAALISKEVAIFPFKAFYPWKLCRNHSHVYILL